MPREVRLIDAEEFADKLRELLYIAEKKADERACSMISYVLGVLEKEPVYGIELKKKVVRHKYGKYKNVLLSDEEYEILAERFQEKFAEVIENYSEYKRSEDDVFDYDFDMMRCIEEP